MTRSGEPEPKGGDTAPQGVSQFATRVLDQLSLSAWLPAAMLVGVGSVLLELHGQKKLDLLKAVTDLTAKPLGVVIVVVFALVLTTMVTQAFELTAIRVLEGYWPPVASLLGVTTLLVRIHGWRRSLTVKSALRSRKKAFKVARETMLDLSWPHDVITYFTRTVSGQSIQDLPPDKVTLAQELGWEHLAPADRLRAAEARERSLSTYPDRHRLMPTRLGNVLRAGEDALVHTDGRPLRQFVIRHWTVVPAEIRATHDQYRTRLDMYCALVFVCLTLAIGGPVLLVNGHGHDTAAIATAAAFGILLLISYRAAITAAQGYVGVLGAIDDAVTRARATPST